MLIINADDWGGWRSATDATLACFEKGRVTSASAMVFMEDSERAARLAVDAGLDVGLHANFNQPFTGSSVPIELVRSHDRVRRFLNSNRYAQVLYNPVLNCDFRTVFTYQEAEFRRIYGREPSHVDGHRHMHLCANMVFSRILPVGQRVRRSFSFFQGEKSIVNRAYRGVIDWKISRHNRTTDYFFALSQHLQPERLRRITDLSRSHNVELMTHAELPSEQSWLMSLEFERILSQVKKATYRDL